MWGSGRPQAGQARDRLHPISRTCPGLGALRELSHLNASVGLCRQLALLSAHISSTHTPRGGGGRGGGRGTALQQCPAAFVFGRGARESWVSALLLLLPLSGLGQVTPCHLLWDGWPVERGHQTTPSITSGSNVPRPAAWSCLPDLLLSLISGSPPNPVLSPSLSGRSQRPP